MFRNTRTFLRTILGLALALFALQPLHAQLDPRLQTSKTDFLELYQASTNLVAKPEILTIFDYSGSMQALMFHPLYVNTDVTDGGADNTMTFTLVPAGYPNNYRVTARCRQDTNVSASVDLTVDSAGNVTASNYQASHLHGTNPSGRVTSGVYVSTSYITVSGSGATRTFSIDVFIYNNNTGSRTVNGGINPWSITPAGSTLSPTTSTFSSSVAGKTLRTQNNTTAWTVPAYDPGDYVKASVVGTTVGTLTSKLLVKPDGSLVSNADAVSGGGAGDVRNWVRAASHVRFSATVGSDLRTVDIPIPWKITDRNSTGSPLSSQTTLDKVEKGGVTYGSLNNIEMDQAYGSSLSNNSTTTTLNSVWYKNAYVGWLFTGKYTVGSYNGKYIVYDAADASLAGGQGNVNWGQGYGPSVAPWEGAAPSLQVPTYNLNGTYKAEVTKDASANMVPSLTRVQATKRAAIQTWIKFQKDVLWAFRFLDQTEANNGATTTFSNSSATTAGSSGWKLLNGSSVTNMNYIAARGASGSTPLTYAMARGLAQFADPNCVFNSIEVGADAPSQCMNHFLILFTDGIDNNGSGTANGNGTTPYLVQDTVTGKYKIDAVAGNRAILANTGLINRNGANWNLFTFAALGAHMADTSAGTEGVEFMRATVLASGTSGTPNTFLPFAIKKRNGVDFQNDHRVTTMTVGVSLGGTYNDASSPKRSLFLGAALGDPAITSIADIDTITPFVWVPADASDPDGPGAKDKNSIYFFDGTDPASLTESLDKAIRSAAQASNISATANPNLPFVGASLGKQIYVGKFQPPSTGGATWPGDLLMFGTREAAGKTNIIGKDDQVATILDNTTAIWTASSALKSSRLWSNRKLYTRPPSSTSAEPGLKPFTDIGVNYTDGTSGLQNYVAKSLAAGSAAQKAVIQFAAGGDTKKGPFDASGRPTANRSNIMGDIINSAPAAMEYKWSDVASTAASYSRLSAVIGAAGSATKRFRLILVGTNQGWMHAFGEVSYETSITDSNGVNQKVIRGDVDELWSFMPTDFLANLDYITIGNNPHRFMVDGSPAIYHLDLPPSTGGSGNGVVDASERAIAIIGLRKGGRSYYALDIHDPFTPAMKWSLVPDEADNLPSSQVISGGPTAADVKSVLKKWGFSSSTPAIGRIQFNGILRDAVFLSGGFSLPEIEVNFPDASAKPTPLGRSVVAVDVYSGAVLAAADLTDADKGGPNVGPIGAGIVPFEFILNSGMAQRAYFMDYKGGLWAWGSKAVSSTAPFDQFRADTSELTGWSIRKVYQDDNNAASGLGGRYTMLPAPFRVGYFPGVGKPGSAAPSAVGVAMISGDRNNPLDFKYDLISNFAPDHHRLTVVFDRQDSRAWGLDTASGPDAGIKDANLMDFSANDVSATPSDKCSDSVFQYITPGCSKYYLAPFNPGPPVTPLTPKFGYYINFPSISGGFIPKGINPPIVVAGSLFYSYFTPLEAKACVGGSGKTLSWFTGDVMNPIVDDSRSGLASTSGLKDTWVGVASDYIAVGTRAVLQGGAVTASNPQPGASLTTPEIHTTQGSSFTRFPKPRVWRTVH